MAALSSYFPAFRSLSSHKLFSSSLTPSVDIHNRHYSCTIIHASSTNRPRASRKVKSNEDLCKDIREFLSMVGLPEDHVPSTKELQHHGRQDLANIVRRRGYKVIRELLTASTKPYSDVSSTEEGLTSKQAVSEYKDMLLGQNESVQDLADESSVLNETATTSQMANVKADDEVNSTEMYVMGSQISTNLSLQEKASKFIQNGELDTVENSGFSIVGGRTVEDALGPIESQNTLEQDVASVSRKDKDVMLCDLDAADMLDGVLASSNQQIQHLISEDFTLRNGYPSREKQGNVDSNEDLDVQTQNQEKQAEINRLKSMLHQKELELTKLKQQIREEKLALSALQTKAEIEISKAQKLIMEKDAELQAAGESLSGLEEVEIQYQGDGATVEVAGSFNGWHDKIKMEPQPSSSIMDPRTSRLWTATLWLYPGVYEIKFVVDGTWRVDPERESVTRGRFHNNILRVSP